MGTALVVYDHSQQPAPRPKMGRPTKYDEWIATRICNTLARGATRLGAALEAGINPDTFYDWLEKREDFSDRVARAEGEAEVALTESVFASATQAEAKGDWKPAIEWLKRRRRADYGDTLDVRKIDAETLLRLLQSQQEAFAAADQPAIEDAFDIL